MSRTRASSRPWPGWAVILLASGGCGGVHDVVAPPCLQVSAGGQVYDPGTPGEHGAPEIPIGFVARSAVTTRSYMVVAMNPLANIGGEHPTSTSATAARTIR